MTEQDGAGAPAIGSMVGLDLTVPNADEIRDFYVSDRRAPGNVYPFVIIRDPAGAVIALMGPN